MQNSNFSKKIKDLRIIKGLTQEQLSESSGLSLRTVQRIESGMTIPRADSLKRLSVALEVSPDEIIDLGIKEDKNMLTILILSQLGFLVIPLGGGIIIPLIIWIRKREMDNEINEAGKEILNFQVTWVIAFLIIFIGAMVRFVSPIRLPISIFGIIGFMGLWLYNLIFIVINITKHLNGMRVRFKPALTFLR